MNYMYPYVTYEIYVYMYMKPKNRGQSKCSNKGKCFINYGVSSVETTQLKTIEA